MTEIKLDGIVIKNPHGGFGVERFHLTTLERNAAGLMNGDYIASKRKFNFKYDAIRASEFDVILDILWETKELFHTLEYTDGDKKVKATVYVGAIPSDLHRAGRNIETVWKGVSFSLIER
jgi:hypothetical protein